MKTNIVKFNYRADPVIILKALLELRDKTFDRIKVPMHRVRWVPTGPTSGYFTSTT